MSVPVVDTAGSTSQAGPEEVVRTFLDNLHRGELEACYASLSPDAIIHEAESLPFGGTWHGPAGFRELISKVGRRFVLKLGPPTIDASGGTVFVRFDIELKSRRTGRSTKMPVLDVYRVTDGAITNLDVFYKDSAEIVRLDDLRPPDQENVT
jgi:ketosteroid isomerase-like protein